MDNHKKESCARNFQLYQWLHQYWLDGRPRCHHPLTLYLSFAWSHCLPFFYTPTQPAASPRNTIIGYGVGVVASYLSLLVTGLTMAGPALVVGVTWPRVIAAALSLGLTSGLMVLLRAPHPPTGATTLIISLGILTQPWQLLLLMYSIIPSFLPIIILFLTLVRLSL